MPSSHAANSVINYEEEVIRTFVILNGLALINSKRYLTLFFCKNIFVRTVELRLNKIL